VSHKKRSCTRPVRRHAPAQSRTAARSAARTGRRCAHTSVEPRYQVPGILSWLDSSRATPSPKHDVMPAHCRTLVRVSLAVRDRRWFTAGDFCKHRWARIVLPAAPHLQVFPTTLLLYFGAFRRRKTAHSTSPNFLDCKMAAHVAACCRRHPSISCERTVPQPAASSLAAAYAPRSPHILYCSKYKGNLGTTATARNAASHGNEPPTDGESNAAGLHKKVGTGVRSPNTISLILRVRFQSTL
jgi:hypothetical protein